ncbi:hypothetical protein P9139_14235 [Curtobacterium flaccumfaciens]|nr:hypothetical protein P9139_14235 [Curtobacterium flaccumfaciens]
MTTTPKPRRPYWSLLTVRVGLVVIAVALFTVATPVTAVVYDVPVALAMLVSAVLSVSVGLAPLLPARRRSPTWPPSSRWGC